MCHLILLLPLATLPIFWLVPPSLSVPIYAVGVVLAGWTYVYAVKAMRLPLVNEDERLQQAVGKVISVQPRGRCRVELLGESLKADSQDILREGDGVRVTGRDGVILHVEKVGMRQAHGR